MRKNSNRFVTRIKSKDGGDTTAIILSAGAGYRMKSYGPKCLLKATNDKTIIEHQISVIDFCFPKSEIITVLGFECDKVLKFIPNRTRVVENQLYEDTNTAESLRLALNNGVKNSVLVIHGDLIFNKEALTQCDFRHSFAIIDSGKQLRPSEIGVVTSENEITRFGYGLDTKWAQIVFLKDKELKILKSICKNREKNRLYTFEILNEVLDSGGNIRLVEPDNMKIIDVDSSRDLL